MKHFCNSTVAEVYHCGSAHVRNAAFRYMLIKFVKVCDSSGFKNYIDEVTLKALITSTGVQASASERLWAVVGWVAHDTDRRQKYLPELLKCIPGALLSHCDMHRLRRHHVVQRSCRTERAVEDMRHRMQRPYHQDSQGFDITLDISELRKCGKDELLFGFNAAQNTIEFTMEVSTTKRFEDLRFTLKCKNVQLDGHTLPDKVTADIAVKLCHDASDRCGCGCCHKSMEVVHGGKVEHEKLCIVKDGKTVPFHVHMDRYICDSALRSLGKHHHRVVLFVKVRSVVIVKECC